MTNWMDIVLSRRSIRKYKPDAPVFDDAVERMLRAAMAAPSACNQQPWRFVVVRDRALLDALADAHPYARMLRQAALAVCVCGDLAAETCFGGYWPQDCAAATENLLLAAHAQGLGAVWIGVHPYPAREADVRRILSIPEGFVPFCLVSVGVPAERKPPSDRFDPAKVRIDRWAPSGSEGASGDTP